MAVSIEPPARRQSGDFGPCPVCDGRSATYAYLELEALERCNGCGLVARREAPTAELYEGAFFEPSGYYGSYFARSAQWRHEARLRLRWLLESGVPSRLLEIGCAGGFFLEEARRVGIDGEGIEPSEDGSRFARDKLHLTVVTGAFEDAEVTGPFDALCAFHVLEHVADPRGFLARSRELLAPGGCLALEVPNIESARAKRDGARWFNLVPDFHSWHFSPSTLPRLVERAGFQVERVDTAFPRHYFRARRVLTRSGARTILADMRAWPSPRRTHRVAGDYLRLIARAPS